MRRSCMFWALFNILSLRLAVFWILIGSFLEECPFQIFSVSLQVNVLITYGL